MTGKRVSAQQTRVMAVFTAEPKSWFDGSAVEHKAGLPGSTVRHLLLNFFSLGLLERAEVSGGYRYRLSSTAHAHPYFLRIQEATMVMQT